MGNIYLSVKAFFETMQIACIVPSQNSKKTLKTGAYVSPEEICLPFKIMMGNYLECIERGADTILITGSCGPCRFGEYCELQMKLLDKLGLKAEMIVIDSPFAIGKKEFWERIGKISGENGEGTAFKLGCLRGAIRVLGLADEIDAIAHERAGYEMVTGECKRLLAEAKAKAYSCHGIAETCGMLKLYRKKLINVSIDSARNPVRIALVGEIYTMIEPYSNLFIEEKLMNLGASTKRLLTPSWWVRDLVFKPARLNSLGLKAASRKYLRTNVGGHARETIAHVVQAKREGMDGVIQVFPLGCMPEIVAKSIMPTIQRDTGLPIMTLVVDEVTGEAGYCTRIEAFMDMLEARKRQGKMRA